MPIILDKQWHGSTPPPISKQEKNTELGSEIRGKEGDSHAALWLVRMRLLVKICKVWVSVTVIVREKKQLFFCMITIFIL